MNDEVLRQYGISFNLRDFNGDKEVVVASTSVAELSGYLDRCFPVFLSDEVIPEMNKALNDESFDNDGGGELCYLEIGNVMSTITNIYNTSKYSQLPTIDLKEILLSYIEWINTNNYEQYI